MARFKKKTLDILVSLFLFKMFLNKIVHMFLGVVLIMQS